MKFIITAVLLFIATAISIAVGTLIVLKDNRSKYSSLKEFIAMKDKEILDAIDSATNDLATRIAARDAKIKEAGELTPELEAEGQAIVARLKSLAADPVNPVPVEAPAPPTSDSGTSGTGSDTAQG